MDAVIVVIFLAIVIGALLFGTTLERGSRRIREEREWREEMHRRSMEDNSPKRKPKAKRT